LIITTFPSLLLLPLIDCIGEEEEEDEDDGLLLLLPDNPLGVFIRFDYDDYEQQ
jgi:hypothetical protein